MTTTDRKPRVMLLDIESTNLRADFGYCLCIGWKWAGEKRVYCPDITQAPTYKSDPMNDKWLIETFAKAAEQADAVVFHYGTRFDYPFLQARALWHGLPPLPRIPQIDTWRISKYQLAISSNRLSALSNLLGVGDKTPLNGRMWVRAMGGDKAAIRYVVKHCRQDVVVLEQVYDRIKALRPDVGPKMSISGCPTCGSNAVQQRGRIVTLKSVRHRMHCQSCGHWWSR